MDAFKVADLAAVSCLKACEHCSSAIPTPIPKPIPLIVLLSRGFPEKVPPKQMAWGCTTLFHNEQNFWSVTHSSSRPLCASHTRPHYTSANSLDIPHTEHPHKIPQSCTHAPKSTNTQTEPLIQNVTLIITPNPPTHRGKLPTRKHYGPQASCDKPCGPEEHSSFEASIPLFRQDILWPSTTHHLPHLSVRVRVRVLVC